MNSNKLIIGLTGGIGSGKTVISHWFESQGIDIIDTDIISRQIVKRNSPILEKISQKFGDWIINDDGDLNRKLLREYVFGNANALTELENITHPAIRQQVKLQLDQTTSDYVIIVTPLLLESNKSELINLCNYIVVVDTPVELQIQRATKRDDQSPEKIQAIMNNQLSRTERCSKADDIILNDGSLEQLYLKLESLHEKFLSLSKI